MDDDRTELTLSKLLAHMPLTYGAERAYHVGPLTVEFLRKECGMTGADLAGMNIIVSSAVPPGKVYLIGNGPVAPPRPQSRYLAGSWPITRRHGVVNISGP